MAQPEELGAGSEVSATARSWGYVLDFYCPELKLAIELEGGIHDDVLRSESDGDRHAFLESEGIRVLYFKNRTLLEISDYVVGVIRAAVLEEQHKTT